MKKTVFHHGDLTKDKVPDSEKIRKMASDKMRTGFTKIKMYLKEPRSSDEMWCIFRVATPGEPPPSQEEKAGKVEQTTGTKKNGNLDRKEKNFSQQAEEGDGGGRCHADLDISHALFLCILYIPAIHALISDGTTRCHITS